MGSRRLLVAAAGSGGHVFPGLAVAVAFGRLAPASVRFVGTSGGMERRLVPRHGFELDVVEVPALRGRSPGVVLAALLRLPGSVLRMRRLLRRFRPQVVFGTGGAVSGVAVLAAWLSGIPSLIFEPNVEPGLATRWSARFARLIAVGTPAAARRFQGRTFVSGTPVRDGFLQVPEPPGGAALSVLVTGGSQGAARLNRVVFEALPGLRERADRLRITHQTGPDDVEAARAAYAGHGFEANVVPWLEDMPAAYGAADLVVCRAGAITCAELAATGRPAILIPAGVAGGHQRTNAEVMEREGAALALDDRAEDRGARFAGTLADLLDDPGRRARMSRAARALHGESPAERLAARLLEMAGPPEAAA